jgi:uncharacterized protein (DUF952 family)
MRRMLAGVLYKNAFLASVLNQWGCYTGVMIIYKIIHKDDWGRWRRDGEFAGSTDDLADGYIHLSTHVQVRETAARHFVGEDNLLLVELDSDRLGQALRWEPSRGGQLFPHYYGKLRFDLVLLSWPLPWDGKAHVFPARLPAA